jgi:FkbM family methyltransferase
MNFKDKVKHKIKTQLRKLKNNQKQINNLTKNITNIDKLTRGIDFVHDITKSFPKYNIDTIFDVGANVGQSSKFYLIHFPNSQIYCFEPIKETFSKLQQNLKENERVYCYQIGLSSVKRNATMALQGGGSESYFILDDSNKLLEYNNEIPTASVELVTLDEFCETNSIDDISYLKIDTEGEDLKVLKGAKRMLAEQKIDFVEVEAGMNPSNDRHVPCEKLKGFLESHGYFLFGVYSQKSEQPIKKLYLRRANLLFISARMGNMKKSFLHL